MKNSNNYINFKCIWINNNNNKFINISRINSKDFSNNNLKDCELNKNLYIYIFYYSYIIYKVKYIYIYKF
jgi:hypothetical protein